MRRILAILQAVAIFLTIGTFIQIISSSFEGGDIQTFCQSAILLTLLEIARKR